MTRKAMKVDSSNANRAQKERAYLPRLALHHCQSDTCGNTTSKNKAIIPWPMKSNKGGPS